jgi:outer membrane usher protein
MAPRAWTTPFRRQLARRRLRRAVRDGLVPLLVPSLVLTMVEQAGAQPRPQRAVLELELNGTRHGDVIVLFSGDDVFVPEDALRGAGLTRGRGRRVRYEGVDYRSLRGSEPPLRFTVNERDLVLEIVAPPHALTHATLDLSEPAPPGMWKSDEPSAFLTYAPSWTDFSLFRLFAEGGATVGPFRVTSSASYAQGEPPVRLMSQAAYADRKHVRELVLGDTYASSGPLGGTVLLGGVGIFRNFELDPYFVRIPRLGYRGSVMAPSTVDVYVNDVLVRRASIAPGEFDLQGIAPASGAGNVRYVVRDPLARQSDVVVDYYASSGVLAPGLTEYTYAAGFERQRYGVSSADYGEPLLLGRFRVGLTSRLTGGLRGEASRTRVSGGTQVTFAGSHGELELGSAVSVSRRDSLARGSAGLVGYYYQRGSIALRAVLKATSARYSTASLDPEDDRDLVEQSTAVSVSIGRRTTVSTLLGFALSRDAGQRARSSITINRQLGSSAYLQVIGARDDRAQGISDYQAFATLSVQLPDHHTASLTGSLTRTSELTASVSRPMMGRTGVGYQASGTLAESPRATASFQGQNRYLRADASYFYDSWGKHHSRLDASGTLLWVPDGGVFVSRPVPQSFALVEVPQTPGATVYLNNQPIGRTDDSGRLLIPDLQSYYGNRLRVDSAELPSDVEVDEGEVVVAPPPHGGVRLAFASRRLHAVRGRLQPVGLPLEALRYGELTLRARGEVFTSPIGARGEFELDRVPSGVWPAEARGEGGKCVLHVPIPVDGRPIEQLGALSCAAEAP